MYKAYTRGLEGISERAGLWEGEERVQGQEDAESLQDEPQQTWQEGKLRYGKCDVSEYCKKEMEENKPTGVPTPSFAHMEKQDD